MIDGWWSWVLTGFTCGGLWLAGTPARRVWGWSICLVGEALWVTYALVTQQWGFVIGAGVFGFVYGRNLYRAWRPA